MSNPKDEIFAFSVEAFCKSHNISRAMYYNLQKEGKGPRLMRVGTKPLISAESAAKWRQKMENETAQAKQGE